MLFLGDGINWQSWCHVGYFLSLQDNNPQPEEYSSWSIVLPWQNYTFLSLFFAFLHHFCLHFCFPACLSLKSLLVLSPWPTKQTSVLYRHVWTKWQPLVNHPLTPSAVLDVWFDLLSDIFDFCKLYKEPQLVLTVLCTHSAQTANRSLTDEKLILLSKSSGSLRLFKPTVRTSLMKCDNGTQSWQSR